MPSAELGRLLPGLLALRLAALTVGDLTEEGGDIGGDAGNPGGSEGAAPRKRKAAVPRAHWGLPTDSASRLVLIALSRLLRTPDEMMLTQAAGSPVGGAFLASLRAAVLRVAVAAGGADAGLNETSVATLFNLSGSSFDRQARYDGASLTLPSRLPWPKAKALVRVMLDSLAASLVVAEGSLLHRMLLQLPFVPLDEQAQAAVAKLIAVVESEMSSRLQRGGGADASSSSSSTWSAQPPQPPQPPALPMPFAPQPQPQLLPPALQPLPPAPPAPPPAPPPLLDVSMSLQSNARRLVQARLGRAMTQPETETLDAALVEALGVLRVGTDEDHRTALQLVALTSLSTPAGAHLWACLLDEAERTFQSVAAYAAAVVSAASAVASAQLAAALWL
jgi:hypothetical protein